MTEAFPISMPRHVRRERSGLPRRAWKLNLSASPKCMRGSTARLLQQLLGLSARRIVRAQCGGKVSLQQIASGIDIAPCFDVSLSPLIEQFRAVGSDALGGLKGALALFNPSLFGEKPGQIDDTANLLRGHLDCATKPILGCGVVFAPLGNAGLRPQALRVAQTIPLVGKPGGFIKTTAEEARRLQVVFEQIADGFLISRIEGYCLFKVLPGLRCQTWSGKRTGSFRSPPVRPSEPK